ncbi:hypothetical protein [Kitasatospora sp. NBC_01266]|uniref:hypothetical protein n=1 Tax=Kitasatospora sp. NBC_01266 TaxID=2903572 RepID=UPI002E37608B|nr:hypothetical protein [Kitasatospora sp. NBC_01266]
MPHKLITELGALRAEWQHCTTYAKDRVTEVEAELTRVRQALVTRAEQLEGQAIDLADQQQDMAAAQVSIDARAARAALDTDQPAAAQAGKKVPAKAAAAAPVADAPLAPAAPVDGAAAGGAVA